MKNKRFLFFLIGALVFSYLASAAVYEAIKRYTPVVRYDDPVIVVVAAKDIQPYSAISPSQLQTKEIPRSLVPRDAYTEISQVAGKTPRTLILADDYIRLGHLTEADGTTNEVVAGLSLLNDPSKRAVLLPVPRGLVLAKGDRVNVIHSIKDRESAKSNTIFENILVLDANEEQAYFVLSQSDAEVLVGSMITGQITYTLSPARGTE